MSVSPGYRLISLAPDRANDMLDVNTWAFTGEMRAEDLEAYASEIPFSRTRAMEIADPTLGEVGDLAGVAASYTYRMRVPGGALVRVAGLTWVGVHPGHRRRGLLRAMMGDHLADARARGEVASALYAAETEIYQRFGYGLAARQMDVSLPRGADLREVPGADALRARIEDASLERHGGILADLQRRMERPGTPTLDDGDALRARFADPGAHRRDSERMRILTIEQTHGTPVAYALFRRAGKWDDDGLPSGTVHTWSFGAVDPAATRRLWSVLLDLDLMGTVKASPLALDDPLLWLLKDPRAARARVRDNIWLRIVDVPAALTAREYLCPVDAVVSVPDPLFQDNAGPWRVTSRDGEGHVEAAPGVEPDVVIGVQELSAAYLGGVSLASLAAAGLVEERTPGAVHALAAAFESTSAPVCNLFF
ncbi:GNAT family N-acetyltransferase [Demequina mangrovi]|uniref:Predicted acetyltransferase n=1 Tax=Demequina mangrovi TaxID=1043493 RepID=A0A1H7B2X6_9MICO|nr:GNAT family N-acetyltransferase [Demequina mangrovi]SEJ67745.1 Predicted acetyltransferase [Demequina mangrovi]